MVFGIFCVSELNGFEIVIFATALCTGKHNMKSVNGGALQCMWHYKPDR